MTFRKIINLDMLITLPIFVFAAGSGERNAIVHKGTVRVDSELGKGTEITSSLPAC